MAHIFVASCRNWRICTKLLKFSTQRMPLVRLTENFRCSNVDTISCLPMLQRQWVSCSHRNYHSSYSTLRGWQTFTNVEIYFGCVRMISSSAIMCIHDEHDKGSRTTVKSGDNSASSSEEYDTVFNDSTEDSAKASNSEAGSSSKAQPVSDADVDKELLRYEYEEFEILPDEEVSIVQPIKESIPVELESKC